jgi:hypothetical protein
MPRSAYGGRITCESCHSIDVRRWHREGRLRPGQSFTSSWTCGGEPFGTIKVSTQTDAVVLDYRIRNWESTEWKAIKQRLPITWTACHFGGTRVWFVCCVYSQGRYCGRRVAVLYRAGELFACRQCYDLAYASQQESVRYRNINRSRKIRMRLGGTPNLFDPFPEKPRGMHLRTYLRFRTRGEIADAIAFGHPISLRKLR